MNCRVPLPYDFDLLADIFQKTHIFSPYCPVPIPTKRSVKKKINPSLRDEFIRGLYILPETALASHKFFSPTSTEYAKSRHLSIKMFGGILVPHDMDRSSAAVIQQKIIFITSFIFFIDFDALAKQIIRIPFLFGQLPPDLIQ